MICSYLCVYERIVSVMCCELLCQLFLCLGKDRLTACLQGALSSPAVQKLSCEEQLGVVLVATYLRSPDFGRFLLEECAKNRPFSLVLLVNRFFQATNGRGQRKAFLPTRKRRGRIIRGNRDLARLRLSSVFHLCGQFLDGSLSPIFVDTSKDGWTVDVDMLPSCRYFLEQINTT